MLRGDGSDPLLIETNTSTEYWQKGASLLTTDPLGTKDVALPENCRAYMIAGTQHGGRAGATTDAGPNVNPRNPHNPMPAVRALLVALDEWVVSGKAPPPSRVPTLADGTLVEPDKTGFPAIPGAAVVRVTNHVAPPGDWVKPQARPTAPIARWSAGSIPTATRWPASACPTSPCRSPPIPAGTSTRRRIRRARSPTATAATSPSRPAKIAQRYTNRADYVAKVQAAVDALMARPADAAGRCRPLPREGAQRSRA